MSPVRNFLAGLLISQTRKEDPMCDDFIDDFDGLDWGEWMIIGSLTEDIVREKREKERIRKEDRFGDDYWDIIDERW